ncbi:MAG TPA: hypothetical protein VET65_04605 [Candidatus Limnocylindrales bacterium]|nr:hypothetical protein [Candidatus Limnocylindrales bacterium]
MLDRDAAGHVELVVTVYEEGEPGHERVRPAGRHTPFPGYRLSELRHQLGGDEGYLVDPVRGGRHFISLTGLAGRDPERTRVLAEFRFVPELPPAGGQ